MISPASSPRKLNGTVPGRHPGAVRAHSFAADFAWGLSLPVALVALWHVAAVHGWVPPQILPAPSVVADSFRELWASGELRTHILASLERAAVGYGLGAGTGLALGTAMGLFRPVEDLLGGIFLALNQIPTLGWLPIGIALVGINERLAHLLIAQAAFAPAAINAQRGIRQVSERWVEVGRIYGLSRSQAFRKIVLPAALPRIFTGLRFGLGNAWSGLVIVELLIGSEGLGYLMSWGRQTFRLDLVLLAIACIGSIGWALDALLARAEAGLAAWRIAGEAG